VDRLLRAEKATGRDRKHCSRTKPESLLARIPVVSFRERSAASPRYVEVDLVSHDGGKAAGDHCSTLTVTDRCSGWTEIVPVSSRAQVYVFAALTTVLVLHSEGGSEFIGDELRRSCDPHGIRFTRSRPYQGNDNPHVEEKNNSVIRTFVGYDRHDSQAEEGLLNRLYQALHLMVNWFLPSQKLLRGVRTGRHITKVYDNA
jgi:hypothetical protein